MAMGMAAGAGKDILIHGHRGARAVWPENTIPAFEHAIEAGADFLELDLAVTRDNVLVVSHDPVLREDLCTGSGTRVIREMTLAQLEQWDCGSRQAPGFPRQKVVPGARIPTLDAVLKLGERGRFGFTIEMKVPGEASHAPPVDEFARLTVEAVRRHGLEKRVIVQSFDFGAVRAVKKLAPELKAAALWSGGDTDFAAAARQAGAEIAAPHYVLVTPERVRAAHAAGIEVVPWTANDPPEWEKLVAAGVDGIITDDPAGLAGWLRERGLR
jgi:glycerophosphoryl diester phosphodiesterase